MRNISHLDANMIIRTQHDESNEAQRVVIVSGENLKIDPDNLKQALKDIKIEVNVPNSEKLVYVNKIPSYIFAILGSLVTLNIVLVIKIIKGV